MLWFGIAASCSVSAEQYDVEAAVRAELQLPIPYELEQGTFVSLVLDEVNPTAVSAIVDANVYDAFENVAIPKGRRVYGYRSEIRNNRHNVVWTELRLTGSGGTCAFRLSVHATTPLGSAGLEDFNKSALAGLILPASMIILH